MGQAKTILIADDSATLRRQLGRILEAADFAVVEAADGECGVAAAQDNAIDLMIVDINMPRVGGLEMIRRVRQLAEHKTTPIIVLTTESGASVVRQGKEHGAMAWIVKPVEPTMLIKAIRKVLKM